MALDLSRLHVMIQNPAFDPDRTSSALGSRSTIMERHSAAKLRILHQKMNLRRFVQNPSTHPPTTYANSRQQVLCIIASCGWHVPEYSKGVVFLLTLALCTIIPL